MNDNEMTEDQRQLVELKEKVEAELLRHKLGFPVCDKCGGRLFKQTQNPQTSTLYGFWVCEKGGTLCPIVDTASLKLRLINPKPYVQSISMVHEEALLAHNGWFAVMDKPLCKVGQPIEFAYAGGGRVVKSGVITAIDAPGTHKFSPFESWWVIEFSERKTSD